MKYGRDLEEEDQEPFFVHSWDGLVILKMCGKVGESQKKKRCFGLTTMLFEVCSWQWLGDWCQGSGTGFFIFLKKIFSESL